MMSLVNIVILYSSVIYLGLLCYLMQQTLYHHNEDEVSLVIKYFNEYFANYYYKIQNHQPYNSLLIQPETDYCIKSDVYKYFHPDIVMKDTYTIREVKGLIKEILQHSTYDCLPQMVYRQGNQYIPPQLKLPIVLTLPFTYYDQLIHNFASGISSLCLFQKYNHLPQRHSLSFKDSLSNNQFKYLERMRKANLSEECIKNATFLPTTYRLYVENECKEFFNFVQSQEYLNLLINQGPQFIMKKGLEVHRGRGITVLFLEEMEQLQESYRYGQQCGEKDNLLVVQKYINNPFLYLGHKIEIRIYFIFASTNPLIVYVFDKALIRRCIQPYDIKSTSKEVHVCNTAIVKQYKENNQENDSEENDEEEKIYIDWKLDYLQELILEIKGEISDPNWLQNYLYPKIDKMIIHAVKSAQHTFQKDSKLAEFFAADFILADNLDLYLIEINYNPQTLKTTPLRVYWHTKMINDIIEIQNAYLRSKYQRFRKIIQQIVHKMITRNLTFKQAFKVEHLQQINKAYMDKLEFPLSSDNLFRKILDENLEGSAVYNDLVQTNCII